MSSIRTDTRRLLGQHFTPEPLVRLVCALGIASPEARVLDPACGEGAFLRGAIERLRQLGRSKPHRSQVCGFEVDPVHAAAARAVPGAEIRSADFFAQELRPEFDSVVGNFPFVRQELLKGRKEFLGGVVRREWAGAFPEISTLSGRADLYLYFFLHAARCLRDGGRMAVISGNSWLHVPYGALLRKFLLEKLSLQMVLESRAEVWFPHTVVNAAVTVLEKTPPRGHDVLFVQINAPLAADADYPAGRLPPGWLVTRTPAAALAAEPNWNTRLRAPAVYFDILGRAGSSLVELRRLAVVRRGVTTGLNKFFFVGKANAAALRIEPQFLAPVIASLKGVKSLVLRPADARHYLLLADKSREVLHGTNALKYITDFENSGTLPAHSPTLQGRTDWYRLPAPPRADLAILRFRRERHFSPANPQRILLGDTVFTAEFADRAAVPLLCAAANGTLFHFLAEAAGRDNMGGGFITTYGPEIRSLRLPAPERLKPFEAKLLAAFEKLARRDVETMEQELHHADRRELDEIIWRALGLPPGMLDDLYESFARMLTSRREFGMLSRGR